MIIKIFTRKCSVAILLKGRDFPPNFFPISNILLVSVHCFNSQNSMYTKKKTHVWRRKKTTTKKTKRNNKKTVRTLEDMFLNAKAVGYADDALWRWNHQKT